MAAYRSCRRASGRRLNSRSSTCARATASAAATSAAAGLSAPLRAASANAPAGPLRRGASDGTSGTAPAGSVASSSAAVTSGSPPPCDCDQSGRGHAPLPGKYAVRPRVRAQIGRQCPNGFGHGGERCERAGVRPQSLDRRGLLRPLPAGQQRHRAGGGPVSRIVGKVSFLHRSADPVDRPAGLLRQDRRAAAGLRHDRRPLGVHRLCRHCVPDAVDQPGTVDPQLEVQGMDILATYLGQGFVGAAEGRDRRRRNGEKPGVLDAQNRDQRFGQPCRQARGILWSGDQPGGGSGRDRWPCY